AECESTKDKSLKLKSMFFIFG
ncbi:hypothetical protein CCACVL1_29246, partial [Corchorus capsularis]